MKHPEYDCDRCSSEVPDGEGRYTSDGDERICGECAEVAEEEETHEVKLTFRMTGMTGTPKESAELAIERITKELGWDVTLVWGWEKVYDY